MLRLNKRLITYLTVIAMASVVFSGCNQDGETPAEGTEAQAEGEDATPTPEEQALADAVNDALNNDSASENSGNTDQPQALPREDVAGTPLGDKSPIAITRIEPTQPTVTGTDNFDADGITINGTVTSDPEDEEKDPHEHEKTPNLFPVDMCQVEINGVYDSPMSRDIITQINAARVDYGIGELTRNTSLLACADVRCKEQTYFIGHFRPNGTSWTTVAPNGEALGECVAVDYRTAEDTVTAWLSVNDTRVQLMNPEYTSVGVSVYKINGTYFIAAEFGY